MFSSNPAKLFHLVLFFSICFSASCSRFWGGGNEDSDAADRKPFIAREIQSGIPFSTREPEVFQGEIVVTSFINGEKSERKTFVARSGGRRILIFAAGEKAEVSFLQLDEAGSFSISREKKIYTENVANMASPAVPGGETFDDFLTAARLSAKASAAFESLGAAENGLTGFRVRLDDSDASEVLIYVDENLKIPVRQEFHSRAAPGEPQQKTLLYAVELRNFQLQADENLFAPPPKDFRKVSREEFDKIVRSSEQ
ncbi:MAG: hypothetical protein M3384_08870 [Acidobacteriota bacterium]|nr:hypothetical protein [Acidobacteriota bacterium]